MALAGKTNIGGGKTDMSGATATPDKVLDGYSFFSSGSDEIQHGSMQNQGTVNQVVKNGESYTAGKAYFDSLTVSVPSLASQTQATATAMDILAGKTAWINGKMIAGGLSVQSIINFSAAVYSSTACICSWQNPARGAFSGVIIVGNTWGTPTSITDGTRYYKGAGDNTAANGWSSQIINGLTPGQTYYFKAFSYALKNSAEWIHETTFSGSATTTKGQQIISTTGNWVVPDGVRSIDVFLVGGGAGGASNYGTGRAAGGSSGFTQTYKGVSVTPGQVFYATVGSGGRGSFDSPTSSKIEKAQPGGVSSFGSYAANGSNISNYINDCGTGGSEGGFGENGYSDGNGRAVNSKGQGTTTRAFGESWGTLYSGGGGGAISSNPYTGYNGGDGGGGNGGFRKQSAMQYATNGAANTGSGGGGCAWTNYELRAADGGTGLIIVRWGY